MNNHNFEKKNIFPEKEEKIEERMSEALSDSQMDLSENNELYRSGRWQPSEHIRFIKGCLQYGNNWKKVSFGLTHLIIFIYAYLLNLGKRMCENKIVSSNQISRAEIHN